jgi:hypothetical protein
VIRFNAPPRPLRPASPNLRSNGNREQYCLTDDAALHGWHAGRIDQLVTQHEGDESDPPAAG